jgi:hypothetical protein
MTPTQKALWYIESHFAGEIALEDIAAVAGVTRWHRARAFGEAAGHSVIGWNYENYGIAATPYTSPELPILLPLRIASPRSR